MAAIATPCLFVGPSLLGSFSSPLRCEFSWVHGICGFHALTNQQIKILGACLRSNALYEISLCTCERVSISHILDATMQDHALSIPTSLVKCASISVEVHERTSRIHPQHYIVRLRTALDTAFQILPVCRILWYHSGPLFAGSSGVIWAYSRRNVIDEAYLGICYSSALTKQEQSS